MFHYKLNWNTCFIDNTTKLEAQLFRVEWEKINLRNILSYTEILTTLLFTPLTPDDFAACSSRCFNIAASICSAAGPFPVTFGTCCLIAADTAVLPIDPICISVLLNLQYWILPVVINWLNKLDLENNIPSHSGERFEYSI